MKKPLKIINLDIQGMTCAGCVTSVEKALSNLNGVYLAEVNFALNRASVHFNPEFVNYSQFQSAVKAAGYSAKLKSKNNDFVEASENSKYEYQKLCGRVKFAFGFSFPLVLLAMAPMLGVSLPVIISPKTEPKTRQSIFRSLNAPSVSIPDHRLLCFHSGDD